ncbi:hypothetical protein [Microbacterium sp. UBA3394]|uniref:hypothetical protein n=1 Tax=Microbacterium sp. UBA3394 TaxID=1946945 RepID=UPI000C492181|nr:hypothetical protein [Microbacterium sp. UBA3394]MAB81705.1 hypothetical protein [Planctomycetota bacterium]MAM53406.1 hypothetical protein [Microbacterium sp.]|tara:strand:+ start:12018 stop:12335 length:318 start_codon:yes stop_codon:yes gene_type:complete
MRVELNLPDKVWAACLNVAEQNHTSVARVVEAAIRDAIRPSSIAKLQTEARRNQILQAWGDGLTDRVIAERTGELVQYVAATRRKAGLPANIQRRATGTNERKTA